MKTFLICCALFIAPILVSAKTYILPSGAQIDIQESNKTFKEFILPSGLTYVAEILIPTAKANEQSPKEIIVYYIQLASIKRKLNPIKTVAIASCESRLDPNAYNPNDTDGKEKFGLWQFGLDTFIGDDIWDWKEQTNQALVWMEKGYWKKWPICNKDWKKYVVSKD